MPIPAPSTEGFTDQVVEPESLLSLVQVTAPFDLTGNPAIALPCGFSPQGLPLGLQIVGRHGEEGLLMRAAHAYEQATDWHQRRPTLV